MVGVVSVVGVVDVVGAVGVVHVVGVVGVVAVVCVVCVVGVVSVVGVVAADAKWSSNSLFQSIANSALSMKLLYLDVLLHAPLTSSNLHLTHASFCVLVN